MGTTCLCFMSFGLTQRSWAGLGDPNGLTHMSGALVLALSLGTSGLLMEPLCPAGCPGLLYMAGGS